MKALRRITLVVLSGAMLAVACLPHDCKGMTVAFARADQGCPSSESAEEGLEEGSIDGLNSVEVIVPGTLCWYPATFSKMRDCTQTPTRAVVVDALATRTFPANSGQGWADEHIDMFRVACEDGEVLYGRWLPVQTTSPGEAAAATKAECPATVDPELVPAWDQDGELGELVGSDFIPARLACTYDYTYSCTTGCSSGSGGGALS